MYKKERYTVKEFIELLQKMPQDAIVAVKYRDEGGIYPGVDYDIEPFINDCSKDCDIGTVLI